MSGQRAELLAARWLGGTLVSGSALMAGLLLFMRTPSHLTTVLAGLAVLTISGTIFLVRGLRGRLAAPIVSIGGVVAAASLALCGVRQGQPEIPLTLQASDARCWIDVRGDLDEGLYWQLRTALDEHPRTRALLLHSAGGIALSISRVAELLRERGVDSAAMYDQCDSACAFLWIAARRRIVAGDHTLAAGFHAPFVEVPWVGTRLRATLQDAEQRSLLQDEGLQPAFIDWAYASIDGMWRPDVKQLGLLGIPVETARDPHLMQFCSSA